MGIPAEALLPFIFGNSGGGGGGGGASGDSAFIPSFGSLATISTGTSWSGDDPYTSTVTLTGYTVTGNTMVSVLPSTDVIEQMTEDGITNIFITNNNGTLTATAVGAAPTAAMTLQVLCTESDVSADVAGLPAIVGDGIFDTLEANNLTDAVNQLSNAVSQNEDAISDITEEKYEGVDITWTRTDQYINSGGTVSTASWYYQFELLVSPGEKFVLTGVNDYSKAIYATLDANGNPVRYPAMGTSGVVSDIEITIAQNEAKLVLQAAASHRASYTLDKYNGYILKDGIVQTNNLSQDVRGKFPETVKVNLLDIHADGIVTGKYIARDGSMSDSSNLNVSDYIPIELNVNYVFPVYANYFGEAQVIYVPYFDTNGNYISFATGTYDGTTQLVTVKFTNVNARYTRINFATIGSYLINTLNHNPEVMMFTQSPYPSEYIPYGDQSYFASNVYLSEANMADGNPLFRKTAVFVGDSICNGGSAGDGLNGWAGRIGRKNQMLWKNFGISGATFTSGLSGSAGVISDQPIADPMYSGTPDYIIIEGGTNDADLIGSALDTPPAKFGSFTLGDYTSDFDNTTYCGAIEKLFKNACNNAKQAKVGVIIAQKMGQLSANTSDYTAEHNNRRKYFETLIQLCEKWGIPYLNLWDGSILNPMLPNQYTYQQESSDGKYYTDGQHLTTEGYDYVSPIIENWMRTL